MKCHRIQELLDELLEEQLPASTRHKLHQHLQYCSACTAALAEHREYKNQLAQLSIPEPDPGYYAFLLRETRMQSEQQIQRNTAQRYRLQGFAAAAALALGILTLINLGQPNISTSAGTEFLAQQAKPLAEEITVLIDVPADMLGARLALNFPAELTLEGYDDGQQLSWHVDLKKGVNSITLPVVASDSYTHGQTLLVAAQIEYNNKTKQFQLPVELFSPHKARYEAMRMHRDQTTYTI